MIIVTGAAGFIGSAVVWRLNQLGESDIVCVDTAPSDVDSANLAPLRYDAYLPHDRLIPALRARTWGSELRSVFHLGACSSTTETNWDYLRANNFEYSRDLCTATLEAGARFVNASSAATYGDGAQGYRDDHAHLEALEPLNPYGRSKHAFDLWARESGALEQVASLKYFNVYGPNEGHKGEMRSMVCKGYEQIRDTGSVRLFTSDRPGIPNGGQQRDFIYVKDAVDMTLWLADHPERNGVFNVGTGDAVEWNRLMRAIFDALDREPVIEYFDMPPRLVGRYQYFTQADMTKLRAAGYTRPVTPVEVAVSEYVRHHLSTGRHLGE